MNKKKIYLFFAFTFLLSACHFDGVVSLNDDLVFSEVDTEKTKGKELRRIPAADYKAKIKLGTLFTRDLKIKLYGEQDDYTLRFKVPKDFKDQVKSGELDLPSSVSKQPYDLLGTIDDVTTQGDRQRSYERCSEQVPVYEREWVCRGEQCGWVTVKRYRTRYGDRRVEFYDVLTTYTLEAEFLDPINDQLRGTMSAEDSESSRRYLYRGPCRVY